MVRIEPIVAGTAGRAPGYAWIAGVLRGVLVVLPGLTAGSTALHRWNVAGAEPVRLPDLVLPVGNVQRAVIAGDRVVTSRSGGAIEAWDPDRPDAPVWHTPGSDGYAELAVAHDRVYAVGHGAEGHLHAIDPATGESRRVALDRPVHAAVVASHAPTGRLAVACRGGVRVLGPDGDVDHPIDDVAAIAFTPAGALWIARTGVGGVERVHPDGRREPLPGVPLEVHQLVAHPTEERAVACARAGGLAMIDLVDADAPRGVPVPGADAVAARFVDEARLVYVVQCHDTYAVRCVDARDPRPQPVVIGRITGGIPDGTGWLLVDDRRLLRLDPATGVCAPYLVQPPLVEIHAVAWAGLRLVAGGLFGVVERVDGAWREVLPPVPAFDADAAADADADPDADPDFDFDADPDFDPDADPDFDPDADPDEGFDADPDADGPPVPSVPGAFWLEISEDGCTWVVGRPVEGRGSMVVEAWRRERDGTWFDARRLSSPVDRDAPLALSADGAAVIVPTSEGLLSVLVDGIALAQVDIGWGGYACDITGSRAAIVHSGGLTVVDLDTGARRAYRSIRGLVRFLDPDHLLVVDERRIRVVRAKDGAIPTEVPHDLPGTPTWLAVDAPTGSAPARAAIVGTSFGTVYRLVVGADEPARAVR